MKRLLAFAIILYFAASISAQTGSQPAFAALAMDGSRVDTAALRGKVVVLNLWFVNCQNCVEEIKVLNQLVEEYKDNKNVVFLGLTINRKPEIDKFLVKNPFRYQIVPNAQMIILSKFGTPDKRGNLNVAFPMHLVLDRDGKIVAKAQGIKGVDVVKVELKKQLSIKPESSE